LLAGPQGARGYLDGLLKTIETHAINRDTIDWAGFRARVDSAAGEARSISDIYPAIDLALRLLNDHESYYLGRGGEVLGIFPFVGCTAPAPVVPALPGTTGYVRIQQSSVGQSPEAIQQTIRAADHGSDPAEVVTRAVAWLEGPG
jgi:carboxyl-terminal processing protease